MDDITDIMIGLTLNSIINTVVKYIVKKLSLGYKCFNYSRFEYNSRNCL